MKELRLSPSFGLANRLLSLVSGWQVADITGATLSMHWTAKHKACGCGFARLFANEVSSVSLRGVRTADKFFNLISIPRPKTNEVSFQFSPQLQSVGVEVCTTWWLKGHLPSHHEYFQRLKVRPTILKEVDRIWATFNASRGKLVGVHIRGTDHRAARKESPPHKFAQRIEALLAREPDVRFLVCADQASPVREIESRFGSTILSVGKRAYNRRSPVAIEQALVDMILLGKARELWGSYNSTFSRAAAEWGGIPLVVVQ